MLLTYILLIILYIINSSKSEKIIFAGIHFRHGARGPLKLNGNGQDLLGINWSSTGELTTTGKMMHYLLGLRNRQRYITEYKLLSEKFDQHELVVYCSDLNRTLLSVASQLQGLYPIDSNKEEIISKEQLDVAVPPVNITFDEINETKNSLNESALPNFMTIIPVHFIDFLIDNSDECNQKINKLHMKNVKTKESIINSTNNFKKKYSDKLLKYYNDSIITNLNFTIITAICDATVADLIEKRNMTDFFFQNNINGEDFIKECYDILEINFRDNLFSDDNNELLLFYNSFIIERIIHYMKKRIDDDIKGDVSKANASDYSSPKMFILSGHDTTLTAQELFFIKFFNFSLDSYTFPTFASQTIFEITREEVNNDSRKDLKYSNYTLYHYFNDNLVFKMTFDQFMDQMDKIVLWKSNDMKKFCYGENQKPSLTPNIIIIIGMGIFVLVLIIIIIILCVKIKNKKTPSLDDELQKGNLIIGIPSDEKED